jgi:hypothetical protein
VGPEDRNILIDYRFAAGNANRIQMHVAELVNSAPELIVANSSPVVAALKQATRTIPIVFAVVNDPVGQGFVASLAHPAGNITGFALIEFEVLGKWMDLLKETDPRIRRMTLLFNPVTAPYYTSFVREFAAASPKTANELAAERLLSLPRAALEQVFKRCHLLTKNMTSAPLSSPHPSSSASATRSIERHHLDLVADHGSNDGVTRRRSDISGPTLLGSTSLTYLLYSIRDPWHWAEPP